MDFLLKKKTQYNDNAKCIIREMVHRIINTYFEVKVVFDHISVVGSKTGLSVLTAVGS